MMENNREKNFVSAVIYVHNVEKRISAFLKMIIQTLEANFEHSEVVLVNDASDDNSLEQIRMASASASACSVSVVNMSYFHGLETAMNAGVDMAIGDFVFEFDRTELDFDEREIMRVYRRSMEGYDIVSAVPDRKERLSSWLFYRVFGRFTSGSYQMETESFRILSRRVINRIYSMNRTVPYRKAVYANCGLRTDSLRYQIKDNAVHGLDRRERAYRSTLAADSLILFTTLGYRFSMAMTLVMMFMSVFMTVYSIVVYLVSHPVEGWATTILFLSVAFFGLFGVLTIVIKYLQLLVDLVFRRKRYAFESIEKLTK